MSDTADAHRRVLRSLRMGRAGRLVVVVVRSGVPLLHARVELRSALRREGFDIVEQDIASCSDLATAIEAALFGRPQAVALIHGFEALPREQRRERLRRSSFGRARLHHVPRPFIVLMRDTTWRWIGHELPDLARWADGPVMIADADEHERLIRWGQVVQALHAQSPYRDSLEDFSLDLGPTRGTPVIQAILDRVGSHAPPRVVVLAGCSGSGRHHAMRHVVWSIESGASHRGLVRTPSVSPVFGRSEDEQQGLVAYLRDRIERAPGPVVALYSGEISRGQESTYLRCVVEAQRGTNKWVLCRAGSQSLFAPSYEQIRRRAEVLYLAPVTVRHRDGTPAPEGTRALAELVGRRLARVGIDRDDAFEPAAIEQLVLASGGLPRLVLQAAASAVSVANTDRLHFEVDDLQRVTPRDVEIALSQLDLCPSPPEELLATLERVAHTGDPATAAAIEPCALVQVDGDEVFGAVHPLLSSRLAAEGSGRRVSA